MSIKLLNNETRKLRGLSDFLNNNYNGGEEKILDSIYFREICNKWRARLYIIAIDE